jgi:hypothetical protein
MISLAPLYKAVAMVDVARNTSITTTIVFFTSYKCKRAGERQVYNVGLFISSCAYLQVPKVKMDRGEFF